MFLKKKCPPILSNQFFSKNLSNKTQKRRLNIALFGLILTQHSLSIKSE